MNGNSINQNSWMELERIHKELFPPPEKEETWRGMNCVELKYIGAYSMSESEYRKKTSSNNY